MTGSRVAVRPVPPSTKHILYDHPLFIPCLVIWAVALVVQTHRPPKPVVVFDPPALIAAPPKVKPKAKPVGPGKPVYRDPPPPPLVPSVLAPIGKYP